MLDECLMKFTMFCILCHKTLGLPSPTILVLFVFSTVVTVCLHKIKSWKKTLKRNTFMSLSPQIMLHNDRNCTEKYPKKHSANCRNFETVLASGQQLTLCMYKWLSHVLGNHQNNSTFCIFTHYNLCIILSFLCSTAHKVPWRSLAMQQIGPVRDGKKFTQNWVS